MQDALLKETKSLKQTSVEKDNILSNKGVSFLKTYTNFFKKNKKKRKKRK